MINTIPPSDSDDPCDDWSGNDIIKTQEKIQGRYRDNDATNL